jgi:carboxymethylenebutenolidase
VRPSRRFRRFPGNGGRHPGVLLRPTSRTAFSPRSPPRSTSASPKATWRPESISGLNQALDAAGVNYTFEIYPGTIHGFAMSYSVAFSPLGLQRHWDRLLPLLDGTLASG